MDLQQILIQKIGIDKLLHFLSGGWLACLACDWLSALLIGLTVGLIKELIDKYIRRSVFDLWDWVATFAGSVVTAVVLTLI